MFIILTYLTVVLLVVYHCLYSYFTRTFDYWKNRNVVGPKPIAFFGNIKESALRRKNNGILFQEYYRMFPKEKVVGIYRMTTPCILIRDLDVIKHIMIKDSDLFSDRGVDFSSDGLGQNIFHADGVTWSALRTRLTPIFTTGKLRSMFYLVDECGNMLMNHLNSMSRGNQECNIRSLTQRYTISSISACAFGVNFNNFENEMDETLKNLDKIVLTPNFAWELDMMYPGLLKKLNLSLFSDRTIKFFDKLVSDIMIQRNGKPSGRGDFMDLILQLRQMGEIKSIQGTDVKCIEITDNIIAAQAFAFFIAGYETSSSTMACLLYQLALNPNIQDKLREEIDSVTTARGLPHGKITYESLKDMKYLERCFLETLRMHPTLDPLKRKSKSDYKIPGTDVIIRKNMIVLISVLGIHFDKNFYPKPEVFDPDRYEPNVVAGRHPCTYLPFGLGPRGCIGMRFGSLQTRLGIAKIISKLVVEAGRNTRTSLSVNPNRVTVVPSKDIILTIKNRTI